MRGTPSARIGTTHKVGITPACAGNTWHALFFTWKILDHPRVCGEHEVMVLLGLYLLGSPPRVRGTLYPQLTMLNGSRITPACAGNTVAMASIRLGYKDHPRVCGEHIVQNDNVAAREGSPPRVRGTLCRIRLFVVYCGITPACAGNTLKITIYLHDFSRCGY